MRELPLPVPGEPPLAGTLTLPDDDLPVPAVVIASGSGPLDRNSNHQRGRFDVARQLASPLAANGLASYRYDKRGVGESPGDWRTAGLHDNVDDLGRALAALAARPEVDAGRVLLAGHSEGIRATTTDVARIGAAKLNARWFREFMASDPREDLRRIGVPVLAVTGAKDLQVDPGDLDTIAALVPAGATVLRVPDLTHTLRRQPGPPSLSRYRKELREPVDAEVLATVVDWCRRTTGSPGR